MFLSAPIDTLRLRQNGRHFAANIFKCIFLNEKVWIPIKISLKFVPKGPINNIPALVQIMAWCRPGDKPLSEPMMVSLTTHICVTQPQWVNNLLPFCSQKIVWNVHIFWYFLKISTINNLLPFWSQRIVWNVHIFWYFLKIWHMQS